MATDLQKASIWKRISAWMFDGILFGILAVALGVVLSWVLGYDGYALELEQGYQKYETQYGVTFEMTQAQFEAMTEEERTNYNAAYEALIADEKAMYAYNMMMNLTLVILSLAILLAVAVVDWLIPMKLGNGQMRTDGVMLNSMQLFPRSLLGKYTVETMGPVLIILMIYWGTMGVAGTAVLAVLLFGQLGCVLFTHTNSAIHDLMAGTVVVDYGS